MIQVDVQRSRIDVTDGEIVGHPRLKLIGDQASGIFNLRITSASLTDDGEYECQVGRYLRIKPIRASAHLVVTCESKYDDVREENFTRPVQFVKEKV